MRICSKNKPSSRSRDGIIMKETPFRHPDCGAFGLVFVCILSFFALFAASLSACRAIDSFTPATPVPSETGTHFPSISPSADTAAPSLLPEASPESTASTPSPSPSPTPDNGPSAKYLGILGYGSVSADDVQQDGAKLYRFLVGGEEKLFTVRHDAEFSIQNVLMEGYEYELSIEDECVIGAKLIGGLTESQTSPVSYTPGRRTLKNLLAAAMQPVGSTLYVYGGGWNWQDDGASLLSRRIGRSRTWREFFLSQDENYVYKNEASPETSCYPFGGWCEYYYAGLDCSGYLGWVFYNTFEKKDNAAGYVFKSTDIAKTLAQRYNFGTYSRSGLENGGTALQSGDVVSFKGHAYLVLGRCEDGSLVILHSSPTPSRSDSKGGGVQLSAIDSSGDGGMALSLVKRYTERYYPEWYARYENICVSYSTYVDFERSGNAGFFRWNIGKQGTLSDPEGILDMSAEEILKELFGE